MCLDHVLQSSSILPAAAAAHICQPYVPVSLISQGISLKLLASSAIKPLHVAGPQVHAVGARDSAGAGESDSGWQIASTVIGKSNP